MKIDDELVRRFLPVSRGVSEEFLSLCLELIHLIRENGIERIKPDIEKKDELLEFVKHVHIGWKTAQEKVINRSIENLDKIEKLTQSLKDARRSKDKNLEQKIKKDISTYNQENLIMRRMIDSIVWAMFMGEPSTVRRLTRKGGQSNFSKKNIEDVISTLSVYNQDDLVMAVGCDLTTFIHVGDILVFDYRTGRNFFVELKSGERNMQLAHYAEFSETSQCPIFETFVRKELNSKEEEQYERIKRQYSAAKSIMSTLNNEGGVDHNTGGNIGIHATNEVPVLYADRIVKCYEDLTSEKRWAIDVIDDCTYIGVYNNIEAAFAGFNGWMAIRECTSEIHNFSHSFLNPYAPPIAHAELPTEMLKQIFSGEIIVIICVDVREFIKVANSMYPDFLRYGNKKETAKVKQTNSYYHFLEHEGKMIFSSDGGVIGSGFFDRIIYGLQYPRQAIAMLKDMLENREISSDQSVDEA